MCALRAAADERPAKSADLREVGLVAGGLLLVIVAGMAAIRGKILFFQPLSLDEYHTLFLVTQGSWFRSISDLAHGADFNPPTLFLLERLAAILYGPADQIFLRLFALASVFLALVTAYAALRMDFDRAPSLAGCLALLSHPIVVGQAFWARFYGPWLLFCALFIYSVARCARSESCSWRGRVAVSVSAVLLCTIHYFGVFSWSLVVATAAWYYHPRGRFGVREAAPMIAGPVALLLCLPIFLGQRNALQVDTWIPPLNLWQIMQVLRSLFIVPILVLVLFATAAMGVLTRNGEIIEQRDARRASSLGAPAMIALIGMPLIVLLFSVAIQPAMVPRYSIVAVLAWCPVIAWAVAGLPKKLQVSACALLLAGSLMRLKSAADDGLANEALVNADSAAIGPVLRQGSTVLLDSRRGLYPLMSRVSRQANLVYLDLSTLTKSKLLIVERNAAAIHHRLYGAPAIATPEELQTVPGVYFYLDSRENAQSAEQTLARAFPQRTIVRVTPRLYRLTNRFEPARAAGPP
jgi:hypothetical protein